MARDVANLIAISTHRLATGIGLARPELRNPRLRCMHSDLRTTINARDPRTGDVLMNQSRHMAEALLPARERDDALAGC
ncbi:MAG: hypothetical protein V2I63_03285 [Pseudomonadales bacterium]|jgi:hypothetical protein|nr:hypothetical protein [Pseudomonadales bacterium]